LTLGMEKIEKKNGKNGGKMGSTLFS